jgi:universal stress protein A
MTKKLHILVPVDFSEISLSAVRAVKKLAFPSAEITLLHIYNPLPSTTPVSYDLAPTQELITANLEMRMLKSLEEIRKTEFGDDEAVDVAIECTSFLSASKAICEFAEKKSIDLIVLTTHGRTGVSQVLMGSVAEKVVRSAPCPVLVVRPDKAFVESES